MNDRAAAESLPDDPESSAEPVLDAAEAAGAAEATPDGLALTVTTSSDVVDADDGELSLREAVELANERAGEDAIAFAEGLDEAVLTGGALEVTDHLVIDGGTGGGRVAFSHAEGPGSDTTLFEVRDASFALNASQARETGALLEAQNADVSLDSVGVYNAGVDGRAVVSIADGTFSARSTLIGEIFANDAAVVSATDSSLSLNGVDVFTVKGSGTHQLDLQRSDLTAEDCGFFNSASGVAIEARGGNLSFSNSNFGAIDTAVVRALGNADVTMVETEIEACLLFGEAYSALVFVEGSLSVDRSAVINCLPPLEGAVFEVAGTLDVTNSTLNFNNFTGSGFSFGGGVLLNSGEGMITNSTIAGNFALSAQAPAIRVEEGAELRLENNLVLANGDPGGPSFDVGGAGNFTSNGGNVFGQDEVAFALEGDALGVGAGEVFALIGPNGQPAVEDGFGTKFLPLLDDPANPAIGRAVPEDAPPVDQRGLPRDAEPDAGAFELQDGVSPPPPGDALTVTFVSEEADYANTLGFYVDGDGDGAPDRFGVLFEEVSEEALEAGAQAALPENAGLFLIRDGANLGLDFEGAAFAFDGRGGLLVTEVGGATTRLKDYQAQFDFEEGQLLIAVPDEGRGALLAWEDKALSEGSYDGDFDDAVFEVRFEAGADEAVV